MAYLGSPFPSTAELMYIRRIDHLEVQVAALEAERDALRKDAERYRWIRDTGRLKLGPVIGPRGGKYRAIISGIALGAVSAEIETLDEAIAAIAAKEPQS